MEKALGFPRHHLPPELWHHQQALGLTRKSLDNSECSSSYFYLQAQAAFIPPRFLSQAARFVNGGTENRKLGKMAPCVDSCFWIAFLLPKVLLDLEIVNTESDSK